MFSDVSPSAYRLEHVILLVATGKSDIVLSVKELDELVGRNVATHRASRSQKEIAQAMTDRGWRWTQGTVSSVENGERSLRLPEAVDLASILGLIHVDLLMARPAAAQVSAAAAQAGALNRHLRELIEEYLEACFILAHYADEADLIEGSLPDLQAQSWLRETPEWVVADVRKGDPTEEDKQAAAAWRASVTGKYTRMFLDAGHTDVDGQQEG